MTGLTCHFKGADGRECGAELPESTKQSRTVRCKRCGKYWLVRRVRSFQP